jgi:hypothetical protein
VSERKRSKQEYQQFQVAKDKEVRNYVENQVFEKLPPGKTATPDRTLRMRWILTWKGSGGERRAKARVAALATQDPETEDRPTASPTMTRSTQSFPCSWPPTTSLPCTRATCPAPSSRDGSASGNCTALQYLSSRRPWGSASGSQRDVQGRVGLVEAPLGVAPSPSASSSPSWGSAGFTADLRMGPL